MGNENEYIKSKISKRKKEILKMISEGYSDNDMARVLKLSRNTISTHVRQMFYLFGINSRAELVALGFRNKLLK